MSDVFYPFDSLHYRKSKLKWSLFDKNPSFHRLYKSHEEEEGKIGGKKRQNKKGTDKKRRKKKKNKKYIVA